MDTRQLVSRASRLLRVHAATGVRIGDISRAAGISERTLRNAFHREHGLSPKQFDIRERLRLARAALADAGDGETVASIATRYGFFELGRFAGIYKAMFGEPPSQTIRRHRSTAEASTHQARPQHLIAHD